MAGLHQKLSALSLGQPAVRVRPKPPPVKTAEEQAVYDQKVIKAVAELVAHASHGSGDNDIEIHKAINRVLNPSTGEEASAACLEYLGIRYFARMPGIPNQTKKECDNLNSTPQMVALRANRMQRWTRDPNHIGISCETLGWMNRGILLHDYGYTPAQIDGRGPNALSEADLERCAQQTKRFAQKITAVETKAPVFSAPVIKSSSKHQHVDRSVVLSNQPYYVPDRTAAVTAGKAGHHSIPPLRTRGHRATSDDDEDSVSSSSGSASTKSDQKQSDDDAASNHSDDDKPKNQSDEDDSEVD